MPQKLKHRHRGFSLLEMIVVMAILGISLSMLYKAAAGATRSIKVSEQYSYAVVMAQSLLDEYSTVTADGVSVKNEGGGYRWSVVSAPVIDETELPAVLHFIKVDVHWENARAARSYSLHSVVPVRADLSDE